MIFTMNKETNPKFPNLVKNSVEISIKEFTNSEHNFNDFKIAYNAMLSKHPNHYYVTEHILQNVYNQIIKILHISNNYTLIIGCEYSPNYNMYMPQIYAYGYGDRDMIHMIHILKTYEANWEEDKDMDITYEVCTLD